MKLAVLLALVAVAGFLVGFGLGRLFPSRPPRRDQPATLHIVGEFDMAAIGVAVAIKVVAKNAGGRVVPDTGITIAETETPAVGAATISDDGATGSFTGTTEGTAELVAKDAAGLVSAPLAIPVVDDKPATLEVQLA